jgi:hypothetical protein
MSDEGGTENDWSKFHFLEREVRDQKSDDAETDCGCAMGIKVAVVWLDWMVSNGVD